MAFKIEDVVKGESLVTTAVIVGATYFLAPVIGQVVRPLVKTVIKGGMVAYDWAADTAAEARDMASEAATHGGGKERVAAGMTEAGKKSGHETRPS